MKSGQVTGNSFTTGALNRHAFVTEGSTMLDLNNLLLSNAAGWTLVSGDGINDMGQIVSSGFMFDQNENVLVSHAFLLTPVSAVPIPATLWLFGTSLAAWLGFRPHRSRVGRATALSLPDISYKKFD